MTGIFWETICDDMSETTITETVTTAPKRGPGRPRKASSARLQEARTNLEPAVLAEVQALAEHDDRSFASTLRILVLTGLQAIEEGGAPVTRRPTRTYPARDLRAVDGVEKMGFALTRSARGSHRSGSRASARLAA